MPQFLGGFVAWCEYVGAATQDRPDVTILLCKRLIFRDIMSVDRQLLWELLA